MISMKKTAIAAAIAMSMGATAAQASVDNFSFSGTFTMYQPGGAVQGGGPITGNMSMDNVNGTGVANITPSTTFSGYTWTAHGITMQAYGPGQVHADMLFDWGASTNIHVTVDFAMAPGANPGEYTVTTLDGPNSYFFDGIPGDPMDNGPFFGFNAAFDGIATYTSTTDGSIAAGAASNLGAGTAYGDHAVPVPAAAWLLGSGLLGLVGVARRKAA